jgi:hypothetical protein
LLITSINTLKCLEEVLQVAVEEVEAAVALVEVEADDPAVVVGVEAVGPVEVVGVGDLEVGQVEVRGEAVARFGHVPDLDNGTAVGHDPIVAVPGATLATGPTITTATRSQAILTWDIPTTTTNLTHFPLR